MKNIIKEILIFTLIALYFYYSVTNSIYIKDQIIFSINIWITKIVPSLFPIFIIVDIIYNSKIPIYFEKYLKIDFIYLFSIISGSPTNAYILNKYKQDITKHLATTKYTSPIFTYTYLKIIFNKKVAIIIMIINIISNLILFLIIKPPKLNKTTIKQEPFYSSLIKSINKNFNTLITILGTIIFFNTLPINIINNTYIKTGIISILEITTSLNNLSQTTLLPNIKLFFTIISLSTCVLCIECKIKSIINDTQINYKKYLIYRLIHLIIFLFLTIIIIYLL